MYSNRNRIVSIPSILDMISQWAWVRNLSIFLQRWWMFWKVFLHASWTSTCSSEDSWNLYVALGSRYPRRFNQGGSNSTPLSTSPRCSVAKNPFLWLTSFKQDFEDMCGREKVSQPALNNYFQWWQQFKSRSDAYDEGCYALLVNGYAITSFCGCLVKEQYEGCLIRFQRDSHYDSNNSSIWLNL